MSWEEGAWGLFLVVSLTSIPRECCTRTIAELGCIEAWVLNLREALRALGFIVFGSFVLWCATYSHASKRQHLFHNAKKNAERGAVPKAAFGNTGSILCLPTPRGHSSLEDCSFGQECILLGLQDHERAPAGLVCREAISALALRSSARFL